MIDAEPRMCNFLLFLKILMSIVGSVAWLKVIRCPGLGVFFRSNGCSGCNGNSVT